jgi:hypothetical protein
VVSVHVCVDDVPDTHSGFLRHAKVQRRVAHGIDDRARRLTLSSKHVRGGDDRIGVEELTENHE